MQSTPAERFVRPRSETPAVENRLVPPADRASWFVAVLAAFMEIACRSFSGARFQKELDDCHGASIGTEQDLWTWIQHGFEICTARQAPFDRARRLAESWLNEGNRPARLAIDSTPSENPSHACPSFLFGRGDIAGERNVFAWFNSRKPRLIAADSAWLGALRLTLREAQSLSGCFAGSSGTLTYDLVSAFAMESSSPLVRILTDPVDPKELVGPWISELRHCASTSEFSCQFASNRCPKNVRWTCRDRILAFLADVHIVLQLRHPGELVRTLAEQQRRGPRVLWILQSEQRDGSATSGNRHLVDLLQRHGHPFRPLEGGPELCEPHQIARSSLIMCDPTRIAWREYLFHYTRACPGPWPGESLHQYHLGLLRGNPLSTHNTLDTLVRILLEGRLRAGGRLVRGRQPVISFSSRGPRELSAFRQWNRSMGRWTLDPYGIAVKRERIKQMGARPAVYGRESVYQRLRPADSFRFQLVDASGRWRHEHEWRLNGDLWLKDLTLEDFLAFVPSQEDADRLGSFISDPLRCVVWNAAPCP